MARLTLFWILVVGASALADAPHPTGKKISGDTGASGEVYELTANGRTGVVKVPKEPGPRAERMIGQQLPDYRLTAERYGGAQLYADELIEVKLPDGRVTKGIFMERIDGIPLDKAVGIYRAADTPAAGRDAMNRKAGFVIGPDHLKAIEKLKAKLRADGNVLYDLNAENIFLVAPEKGYVRLIDPTVDEVGKGVLCDREVEKSFKFVTFELESVVNSATPAGLGPLPAGCLPRISALASP